MTDIVTSAKTFQAALRKIRETNRPAQGSWYSHDSLSAVMQPIGPLLTDTLLEQTRGLPLLELGCGDGDLAFFFESLGYQVTAVDHPLTNCNQMHGVHALKAQLHSAART